MQNGNLIKSTRKNKLITVMWGLFLCPLLFSGCGRKEAGADPNRIVYQAEYLEIGEENGRFNSVVEKDGWLYGLTSEYNEAEMRMDNKVIKISLTDGSQEDIILPAFREQENVMNMLINNQGNFTVLTNEWAENGPDRYYFHEITMDGQAIGENEITDILAENKISYVNVFTADKAGNIYVSGQEDSGSLGIGGMSSVLLSLGPDGTVNGTAKYTDYIDNMFAADEGLFIAVYSPEAQQRVLKAVDFTAGTFGADIVLSGLMNENNIRMTAGGSTGLIIKNEDGLYECDWSTGQCVKLLDWMESDIDAANVDVAGMSGAGPGWAIYNVNTEDSSRQELLFLRATTAGALPDKELIRFGGMYINQDLKSAIIRFNKTNERYRIEVKEYQPADYEDYVSGLVSFHNALAGSDGPDLISLESSNYQQLQSKGVLADLSTFMAEDETFNRADYLENCLSAYETDGKIYGLMTGFSVGAIVGSAEILADIDRWTITEMIDLAAKHPEAKLFNANAEMIMQRFLVGNVNRFIDWENGECFFNGEDFINILEFAATFGNGDISYGSYAGFANKEYLLMEEGIDDPYDTQILEGIFGGPVKIVGYPTDEGSGMFLMPQSPLGMNARSKVKEGAWEFISFLLSDEEQSGSPGGFRWGFPVRQAVIDELCEKAMEKTYTTDENGNQIEQSTMGIGMDDFSMEVYASSEQQIAQLTEVLEKADTLGYFDDQVYRIIAEEAAAFFAGQKTAAEVADIIQSRARLYVSENR